MSQDALSESVKARVPEKWKERLQVIATAENLDLSDIVRRAIAQYIARQTRRKGAGI